MDIDEGNGKGEGKGLNTRPIFREEFVIVWKL